MEKICDFIMQNYEQNSFNDQFWFYPNRKDFKDAHRTGIFTESNQSYFFKIVDINEYVDEDAILKEIEPYNLKLVTKYFSKQYSNKVLNLYECIDAVKTNAYNYLRNNKISISDKQIAVQEFFNNYLKLILNTATSNPAPNKEKNEQFFRGRCHENERLVKYYGNNLCLIRESLSNNLSLFDFISKTFENGSKLANTLYAYSHGDFHDFNFSFNGTFWDTDTFGYNSLLSDFCIFYWHFLGRENYLILKYNPWLNQNMFDNLNHDDKQKIYQLKKNMISRWWTEIYKQYEKINKLDIMKKEFKFRLLCRIFLIDNVLKIDANDRNRIFDFVEYISNCNIDKTGEFLFAQSPFDI